MAMSTVVWTGMTAITGLARSVWQLLLARTAVGIGESGVIPTAYALLSDYYPPVRRAPAMGIFTSGSMVGVMAGSMLGGWIGQIHGWRWAFIVAALPGLPLAAIFWLTFRRRRSELRR